LEHRGKLLCATAVDACKNTESFIVPFLDA